MSEFSDYLQGYMSEHGITSGDLARMLDYDRTSLFRYVKGSRIPSDREFVRKMMECLRMNVFERNQLLRYYDFLVLGKNVVESYEGAAQLLKRLSEQEQELVGKKNFDKNVNGEFNRGAYALDGLDEIYNAIIYLGKVLLRSGAKHQVYVCMQPDYTIVQMFLQNNFEGSRVRVEQIVCLEQDLEKNQDNFKRFQEILPTGIGCGNYDIRYYYDSVDAHINSMNWMPNLIMGDDVVIQFDKEMKHGILVRDQEYYGAVMSWYRQVRENTTELLKEVDSMVEAFPFQDLQVREGFNVLFSQPCIGRCISSDIYETNLLNFPGRDQTVRMLITENGDWEGMDYRPGKDTFPVISYFSKKGIIDFVRKGLAYELPASFYKPLDVEQRRLVIRRLIRLAERSVTELHILDDGFTLPNSFCFYFVDNEKNMLINQIGSSELVQIKINERGISQGFSDFMHYLREKKMLTDNQEAVRWLKSVLVNITAD